jgi:hypothetical protein
MFHFVGYFKWLKENPQYKARPLATDLRDHISRKLIDDYRAEVGRTGNKKTQPLPADNIAMMAATSDGEKRTRFEEMVEDLPPDAQRVVRLCLRPPLALSRAWDRKGGTPHNMRSSVRQYLEDDEWPIVRIRRAFAAIREAL